MNNTILIDINQHPGAVAYAKQHDISFEQLVDNLLMKFQTFTVAEEALGIEAYLDALDEELMMQTSPK